jgi:hypothetical protein
MVYVTILFSVLVLTSVWLMLLPVPFCAPLTSAGAVTVQAYVVPDTAEDNAMDVAAPEQIVVVTAEAIRSGNGFTVIV